MKTNEEKSEEIRKKMNDAAIKKWGHIMYPRFTGKPAFYYEFTKWLHESNKDTK